MRRFSSKLFSFSRISSICPISKSPFQNQKIQNSISYSHQFYKFQQFRKSKSFDIKEALIGNVSGVTTEIVDRFNSAIVSHRYIVYPTRESLLCTNPTFHVDSNYIDSRSDFNFQIGIVSRSPDGNVLWALVLTINWNLLIPKSLPMSTQKVDINIPEIAGVCYVTILARNHGLFDFRIVTDSLQSISYFNSEKNTIGNRHHRYLIMLGKQMWFDFGFNGDRLIWVENFKNEPANALSRFRSESDKWLGVFFKFVKHESPYFLRLMEKEHKEKGKEVLKGQRFEQILQENMKLLREKAA